MRMKVNYMGEVKETNAPNSNLKRPELMNKSPKGAMYFEAIASSSSLNMNGYKIDVNAWAKSYDEYMNDWGGKVYYQHDMKKPIGATLSAEVIDDMLWVFGYVYDDTHSNKEISRGLTTDISTGHYNLDWLYENLETGKRITKEQMSELENKTTSWDEVMKLADEYVVYVTELLWVEYSFVTV